MTTKNQLAERLRVAQDFGTEAEIADALALFEECKKLEKKDAARQAVGLAPSLQTIGERIAAKRAAAAAAAPQTTTKKTGAGL